MSIHRWHPSGSLELPVPIQSMTRQNFTVKNFNRSGACMIGKEYYPRVVGYWLFLRIRVISRGSLIFISGSSWVNAWIFILSPCKARRSGNHSASRCFPSDFSITPTVVTNRDPVYEFVDGRCNRKRDPITDERSQIVGLQWMRS